MKMHVHSKVLGTVCAVVWMAAGVARAQMVPPLYVGNLTPVTNALGRNLPGNNGDPGSAARVEIRQTGSGGAIVPPDPSTGEGNDAINPLVQVSYMGRDVIGANPGLFSETFTNRLPTDTTYFARVYDAPAPGSALYYANSAAFAAPPSQVPSVEVVFQPLRLVSGEEDIDTDGDGIPDAMESEMGLSPSRQDTDGDGYKDYFEAVNSDYLNPTEPDEPLSVQIHRPALAGIDPYTVSWWTIPVPGMQYRLEYTDALLVPEAFVEVWSGAATATNVEIDVDEWVRTNSFLKGFFRVLIP